MDERIKIEVTFEIHDACYEMGVATCMEDQNLT